MGQCVRVGNHEEREGEILDLTFAAPIHLYFLTIRLLTLYLIARLQMCELQVSRSADRLFVLLPPQSYAHIIDDGLKKSTM